MKKLLSLLLVLAMTFSLFSGAAVTAFADDEPVIESEIVAVEDSADESEAAPAEEEADADLPAEPEAPAEEPEAPAEEPEAPAEEPEAPAEEPEAPAEEPEAPAEEPEAPAEEEPVAAEAEPVEVSDEAALAGTTYTQAAAFSGTNFIIGNVEGVFLLIKDGAISSYSKAPTGEAGSYTVSSGQGGFPLTAVAGEHGFDLITNGGAYLAFDGTAMVINASDPGGQWDYKDGKLYMDRAGTKNYIKTWIDSESGITFTTSKDEAMDIIILTDGKDPKYTAGTPSSGGGGGGSSSGSSVSYDEVKGALAAGYAAFVVNDFTFGVDRGSISVAAATVTEKKLTVTSSNYLEVKAVEGGFTFAVEDPPGETTYLYVDGPSSSLASLKSETAPDGCWTFDKGTLAYVVGDVTYYITGASATGVTIGTEGPAKVKAYSGTDKPSKGGGGGGSQSSDPADIVDAAAPSILAQPTAPHWAVVDEAYDAPVFTLKVMTPAEPVAPAEESSGTEVADPPTADIAEPPSEGGGEGGSEGGGEGGGEAAVETPTYEANALVFIWKVNGEDTWVDARTDFAYETEYTSEFVAEALQAKEVGVYVVNCVVGFTGEDGKLGNYNTSWDANFIVCKGVQENSVLTFSDVHQTWGNLGVAINDAITLRGGMIPALIICTGDWKNGGHYMGYNDVLIETATTTLINRLSAQIGQIDTVWVSGNHDNGYAAGFHTANLDADLGLDMENYENIEERMSGTGIIYNSNYDSDSVDSSAANDGLYVIGINYEDTCAFTNSLTVTDTDGNVGKGSGAVDYGDGTEAGDSVYKHLDKALATIAADYNGELVIISTHLGIHTLGVDSSSAASGASAWAGGNEYNGNNSAAIVHLLNDYVDAYGMNIMWLFGHDHSKGEGEFIKLPGETITSTVNYADKTTEDIVLKFTYGHAGYITDGIGGKERYSYITWDDDQIVRTEITADGNHQSIDTLTKTIDRNSFPLDEPVVTVGAINGSSLRLSWNKVANAAGYNVYYSTAKDAEFTLLTEAATIKTSYACPAPPAGQVYYYKVEAVPSAGYAAAQSAVETSVNTLAAPKAEAAVNEDGAVVLTWAAIDGAAGYSISRADTEDGEYAIVEPSFTETTFVDDNVEPGKVYFYKVAAKAAAAEANSEESAAVSATIALAQPVVTLSNVAKSGKIFIKWTAVEGATSYTVYRATSKTAAESGNFKKLITKDAETLSTTNVSAVAGKTYYYKVVANAENEAASSESAYKARTCDLARPVVTLSASKYSGKPVISWTAIEGATGYKVYRSLTGEAGSWKLINTIKDPTKLSTTNTSAVAGKTYYYKVIAIGSLASGADNSAYSVAKSITVK